MDGEIRLIIEGLVDEIVNNPVLHEKSINATLMTMGIEPNLESALSYFAGFVLSFTTYSSRRKFGSARDEDIEGARKLLRRRADEIR